MRLGMFDPANTQPYLHINASAVNAPSSQALVLRAAQEGIVMLKNNNSALPFAKDQYVAVIGPNAKATEVMQGKRTNQLNQTCSSKPKLISIFSRKLLW
jgi:beta-glucosidase-like glycosyl hydrolase